MRVDIYDYGVVILLSVLGTFIFFMLMYGLFKLKRFYEDRLIYRKIRRVNPSENCNK